MSNPSFHRRAVISLFCLILSVGVGVSSAQATVIKTGTDAFKDGAPSIGFNDLAPNTANPTFEAAPNVVNGTTVSFGGYFTGQSPGTVSSCGALGCLNGQPSGSLAFDPAAGPTFVTHDASVPGGQVLSGAPLFAGPISILFGADQTGVGVSVGSATAPGAERLTAFDRHGSILASIVNDATGYSFLALASDNGSVPIAGVQITRTGATEGGFAVNDLRFGGPNQIETSHNGGGSNGNGGGSGDNNGNGNGGGPNGNNGGGSNGGGGTPSSPVPAPPGNMILFALALGLTTVACRRRRLKVQSPSAAAKAGDA